MTFFASPPSATVTGGITIALAIVILVLLLVVIHQRLNSRTILHITLIIDIIFCVSMLLNSAHLLGVESQRRKYLLEAE